MYVSAIVLAAGRGIRFKSRCPKPLVNINSKPLIIYSLETLSKSPLIKEIIVVANSFNQKQIIRRIKKYRLKKVMKIILGGKERQDSVFNGLKSINAAADLVLIHDAARPCINTKLILALISESKKTGAAIAGVPVKATIKLAFSSQLSAVGRTVVKQTLDRENLWEIQTPQVFKKGLILEAYRKFGKSPVTDDAMLVEKLGRKVYLVLGSYNNIKITTPEDLLIAGAIIKGR
ncbi:MAG: 2-C-methyl-D-erythritol 4-phosphate cytidylyltransferase [Candidatus Omnitrophica bacterium]|jgi:2-C-methyl-D-erythritol 4-phosphate cytidylyltransferase|nr:2-C-methyl-D-erythritol 4-phosphate cytidylyltransferase [Candidatus Omnitrophota bacterium]